MRFAVSSIGIARAVVAALLWACAWPAAADLLTTNSGDSLSGALTRIVDGVLVFRTSLKGQMMLPVDEVKSLTTDGRWVVTDREGVVYIGRIVPGGVEEEKEGATVLSPLETGAMVSARLAPAATTTTEASPDRLRVSGGMGVEGFDGTESGVAPRLRLQGSRWGERINTSLQLNFDPSGDDTPEFFDGRLEITPTGEASWVPFVRALIERDTHEALRYRTGLTLGFRYRFSESTENGLELLSGLGVSHGDWRGGYLDRPDFRLDRLRERETELNAHLGLRYRGDAPWGGAWGGFAELTPSLTDADEFRAGAGTMIEYPMSDRLRLRLDMVLRYEHDPALSGLDELGTRVGASLELDF